jgi:hypothetical protein
MSDIRDISFYDIEKFLDKNGISFIDEDDAYNKTLLSLKRERKYYPDSIIEWLIAHNLIVNNVNIPSYTIQEIDNMSQIEINQLAKLLTMKGNNRENIKNILRYLHKLDDISLLPEINDIILQKLRQLEVQDINFNAMKFEDIIDLLSTNDNKALIRKLIYDNMERIIFYNVLGINTKDFNTIAHIRKIVTPYQSHQRSRYSKSIMLGLIKMNEEEILKNNTIKELNNFINILNESQLDLVYINMSRLATFIINLLESDEFALAKKAFDIAANYDFINFSNGMSIEEYLDYYLVKNNAKKLY